ncbi:MAG: response regulator transcription factor [Pirellulales bacterium]|nr:response regulator transcription factor [Pirellulales bacterium]
MAEVIRLHIVHRNRLFRECMAAVLSGMDRYEVWEADHTEPELESRLATHCPDALLVDSQLPECPVGLIRHVQRQAPRTKIVLLVHAAAHENLMECIEAGVHGCVLENGSLGELCGAVERVMAGETFCSPALVQTLFERLSHGAQRGRWQTNAKSVGLTQRELEIVYLISQRLSNKQIARRLAVSLYTIKNHVHNIIEKLQVPDRFAAVEFAQRQRWLLQPREAGAAGRAE